MAQAASMSAHSFLTTVPFVYNLMGSVQLLIELFLVTTSMLTSLLLRTEPIHQICNGCRTNANPNSDADLFID
jgi:hypothetical protein